MSITENSAGKFFESLKEIYSLLEDDLSREIYEARIHSVCTNDERKYVKLCEKSGVDLRGIKEDITRLGEGEPFIIYGVGRRCSWLMNLIQVSCLNVEFVLSDGNYEQIKEKYGQQVFSLQELVNHYPNSNILITPKYAVDTIKSELLGLGVEESKIHEYKNIVSKSVESLYQAQYYDEVTQLTRNEIFVDVGAYDGMTSVQFAEKIHGQYEKIYMFEAEGNKKQIIESAISKHDLHDVELHMKGLWNCKDTMFFNGVGDGTSSVTDSGMMSIEVDTLDHVLNGRPITFMKMDIEGAEMNALMGAKETIKKHKPKLAICIYHKPEDIIEIPMYIRELVPEYKLYIRHYEWYGSETVLYAIP